MTSFAIAIEPEAQPRLASVLSLTHAVAAAGPWIAHCPPALAAGLSLLALAGLLPSLARVPGPHCRLQAVRRDAGGWRVRLLGQDGYLAATLGPATRATAALIVLEVVAGGRRFGWLLPREALPADEFRRLKALIRLS